MRVLLALLAMLLVSAAPPRDWSQSVARTAQGNFVVGNPQAKVRLVEYLSYACPHCAEFIVESAAVKDGFVKRGSLRVEYRAIQFNQLDLAAAMLAACTGPKSFVGTTKAMYAQQREWGPRGQRFEQVNARMMALYTNTQRLRAIADGSGLTNLVRARGLSDAAIEACLADDAAALRLAQVSGTSLEKISGTPSFEVNGTVLGHIDWPQLEPILRSAGAR